MTRRPSVAAPLSAAVLGLAALACTPAPAAAQSSFTDPNSGIELISIGAVGNAPYRTPNPNQLVNNRGSVGYVYNIGKFEVTTAQWAEFFNAAFDRPANDRLPHLIPPDFWGAAPTTPSTPGGLRWTVPAGNEMRPVGDISWRMAAMYCNWLHNGKSTDRAAFLNGAYDVSTFGFTPGGTATDQAAHNPGARYWIPTWDEWLKAAHYDPNKQNADGTIGGWWQYGNASDTPYTYGPPGVGTANSGYFSPSPFGVPLGAYPDVQSPWGLLDIAGGTTEWTESVRTINTGDRLRFFDGSYWSQTSSGSGITDQIINVGASDPHIPVFMHGLRVASSIPVPGSWVPGLGVLFLVGLRKRR